jgi:hypothetical protein
MNILMLDSRGAGVASLFDMNKVQQSLGWKKQINYAEWDSIIARLMMVKNAVIETSIESLLPDLRVASQVISSGAGA